MVRFTEIRATDHYVEHHEKDVPWHKVFELVSQTKNPRKKGDVFEIEQDGYYVLFKMEGTIIHVINAKRNG